MRVIRWSARSDTDRNPPAVPSFREIACGVLPSPEKKAAVPELGGASLVVDLCGGFRPEFHEHGADLGLA
jgi:hypothetical protein